MEFLESIQKIATGIGSIGIFIGFLVAWKTGLLSFLLNLKKNGNGNGYDSMADKIAEKLVTNHFHGLIESNTEILHALERIEQAIKEHDKIEQPLLNNIVTSIEVLKAKI